MATKHVMQNGSYTVYGMFCSYFTKKLENYFLVKGIPFESVEIDSPKFTEIAERVGVAQFPVVECPDGSWLSDTTLIMQEFENGNSGNAIRPRDPLAAFCSILLEDCFDEWLWAPALYYRWAFDMDQRRRSEEFTYTVASNGLRLPRFALRKIIKTRQVGVHLKENGLVTPDHCRQIEDLYIDLLDLLQPIFASRPFLFGDRPCEADFGLQGPMLPHFANDPTSQEIMQVRAPQVFRWVAQLWSTRPENLSTTAEIDTVPKDLVPLFRKLLPDYLSYLVANCDAYYAEEKSTQYRIEGLEWDVATAPYRVFCLAELQCQFQALTETDKDRCTELLGTESTEILGGDIRRPAHMGEVSAAHAVGSEDGVVSRLWSKASPLEAMLDKLRSGRHSKAVPELKREGSDWLPIYFRHHRAR